MSSDELLRAITVINDSFGDNFDAENFKEMVSLTKAYYQDRRYFRSLVAARDEERKGRTHLIKSVRSGNIAWAKKLLELLDTIDSYTVESTQFLGKECYICYESFVENQIVYKVPCRGQHIFHKECIDKWVNINSTCPYCRDPISLDDITGYINKSSRTDKNVLYYAIKLGNQPFVEQLIEKGAMIEYRNASPLHLAAGFSHNDLITYFLAKGDNIEKPDGFGNTPLYYAASYAEPTTIKCLLDNSANWFFSYYNERADCKQENTMLHVAVKHSNRKSIPYILDYFKEHSISIDMKDSEEHTSLVIAVLERHNDLVEELVEAGASLKALEDDHPLYFSLRTHFYDEDEEDFSATEHSIFGYLLKKTEEATKEQKEDYVAFLSGLLKSACIHNEMEHAKYLLKQYPTITVDTRCFSSLACSRNTDYFIIHGILDRLFQQPEFFLECVKCNNLDAVKAYVQKGLDCNVKDAKGNSALHLLKSQEMCDILKDQCSILSVNEEGETPLHTYLGSCSLSHRKPLSFEEAFKGLFQEEEEEVEPVPIPRRATTISVTVPRALPEDDDHDEIEPAPLRRALLRRVAVKKVVKRAKSDLPPRLSVIDLLLQKGVDLHAKNKKGLSAFQIACHRTDTDNFSVVLRLLDAGADINECSTYQAPLHIALVNDNSLLIKELVRRGADINRLFDEETILHYAVQKKDKELLILLFEKGMDVNMKNKRDETALWHAFAKAKFTEDEFCALLIEKGAVLKDSIHGRLDRFLFEAVSSGSLKSVKLLVELGANVNERDKEGQSVVFHSHSRTILEYLIEQGADINIQDSTGCTALHYAYKNKDETIIAFLLEKGSDSTIKDNDGHEALYYKEEEQEEEGIEIEFEADANEDDTEVEVFLQSNAARLDAMTGTIHVGRRNGVLQILP